MLQHLVGFGPSLNKIKWICSARGTRHRGLTRHCCNSIKGFSSAGHQTHIDIKYNMWSMLYSAWYTPLLFIFFSVVLQKLIVHFTSLAPPNYIRSSISKPDGGTNIFHQNSIRSHLGKACSWLKIFSCRPLIMSLFISLHCKPDPAEISLVVVLFDV